MLIELLKVTECPGSLWLAEARAPFGHAAVRWYGDRAAEPGEYHVEWTIDEDIIWGQNATAAGGVGPGLRTGGQCVVLRGQLGLTEDGAALLDFDGTHILLDLADPPPGEAAGGWVELFIQREKVGLHPYVL
ncbi:hypothetical protein [Streptomyces sp. SJL17-1]|uniref:hypothetical protein n=1 Tax=Streptomyces sp. SJL17-1 TaxID=2967223 RepID=UPI002966F743|nr:hypothetical protein [Streptomyces sp. SJL17-1]